MSWWAWLLIVVGVVVIVALIWWLQRRPQPRRPMAVPMASPPAPRVSHAAPAAEPETTVSPGSAPADDLTRIEGIGPKIAAVLGEAGITTFSQLAVTGVDQLMSVLRQAGLRLAAPTTWPAQAALAAAGKWQELEALQSRLKGGRRV